MDHTKSGRHLAAAHSRGTASVVRRNHQRMLLAGKRTAAAVCPSPSSLRDHRLRRLESVLFLAREPLNTRKLSQFANLADGTEARTLIRRLNEVYDATGRAFRVESVAGGYQLLTRPQFANWVRRLRHVPAETRLSAPALETLAVIAYRQPVLRADIEAIRGVNCGEILRQLMERDLVRIGGRSEELGRPYLYATTKNFLRMFGLQSLDQLPRVATMRSLGMQSAKIPGSPADIEIQPPEPDLEDKALEDENMPVVTRHEPHMEMPHRDSMDDQKLRPLSIQAFDAEDSEEYDYDDDEEDDDDDDDEFDDYDDEFEDDEEELEEEAEEEVIEEEMSDEEELDEEEEEDDWEEVDDEDEEEWDDEDDDDWDYEEDEEEEEEEEL